MQLFSNSLEDISSLQNSRIKARNKVSSGRISSFLFFLPYSCDPLAAFTDKEDA